MEERRKLVFIVGSARSGTTFLAKLLDSSPDVFYHHEPDSTLKRNQIPFLPCVDDYANYEEESRHYLSDLVLQSDAKSLGTRPIFAKSYRSVAAGWAFTGSIYMAKLLERLGLDVGIPSLISYPGKEWVNVIKSVDSPCRLPLFSKAWPGMKSLHLVRHPCAVVASLKKGQESGAMKRQAFLDSVFAMPETAQYPFELEDMQKRSWAEKHAFTWMVQNNKIYAELERSANYRLVIYEDLCRHLVDELGEISAHCGIDFGPQMRRFAEEIAGFDGGEGSYFGVKKNVLSSLDKWKSVLDTDEIGRIENIVCHSEVGRRIWAAV